MKDAGDRDRILGAVLAGGAGRRFGGDKTAAEVAGVSMIRRAVEVLSPACLEVVVISSRDETPTGPWRMVPDQRPGRGPLAGMEAALAETERLWPGSSVEPAAGSSSVPSAAVFVLAADLPLVGPETVARMVEAYRGAGEDVLAVAAAAEVAPNGDRTDHRRAGLDYEPLCAIYDVRSLEAARRLLDEGRSAARELFSAVPGIVAEVGGADTFLNVNTREDAERADALLKGSPGREGS